MLDSDPSPEWLLISLLIVSSNKVNVENKYENAMGFVYLSPPREFYEMTINENYDAKPTRQEIYSRCFS